MSFFKKVIGVGSKILGGATGGVIGAGASILGGLLGSRSEAKSADRASAVQQEMARESIAEQRRQFDHIQSLLNPYVQSGNQALGQTQDLMGLNGYDKQQQAIDDLNNSPFLQSAYRQAENALLQNASATGGLRGGNVQSALADNRMNMLNQAYLGQLSNLGGLVSIGQNAAAGVGNAGANLANNVSSLNQNMGQAMAGGILARGQAKAGLYNTIGGLGTAYIGRQIGLF